MAPRNDTDERPAYDPAEARRLFEETIGPIPEVPADQLAQWEREAEAAIAYAREYYGHQVTRRP